MSLFDFYTDKNLQELSLVPRRAIFFFAFCRDLENAVSEFRENTGASEKDAEGSYE